MKKFIFSLFLIFSISSTANALIGKPFLSSSSPPYIIKADGYVLCTQPEQDACSIYNGPFSKWTRKSWQEYVDSQISYPTEVIGISFQDGMVVIYFKRK